MSCAECNSTKDLAVCEWPGLQFVLATYGDLVVGDRVRRARGEETRPPAKVAVHEPLLYGPGRGGEFVRVVLAIGGREKQIQVMLDSLVKVERMAACGAVCCELHRVERDDRGGHPFCLNHARAWEMVA